MIVIGIDPAFRKGGHTIMIRDEQREVRFKVFKNWLEFMKYATDPEELPREKVLVGIENSNLTEQTFWTHKDKKGRLYTYSQSKRIPGLAPLSKAEVARISRNVGANQAASQITVDLCRWIFGASRVVEMSPKQKGGKWKDYQFRGVVKSEGDKVYGYNGKTGEQDKRDAYQIGLKAKQMYYMKSRQTQ